MTTQLNTQTKCPTCFSRLDAATGITGKRAPKQGDVTVCAYCCSLLRFGDELTVERLTATEYEGLPDRTKNMLHVVQCAAFAIADKRSKQT